MKIQGIYKFKTDIIVGKILLAFSSGSLATYDADLTNSLSVITISIGKDNNFELQILPIVSGNSLTTSELVDYYSLHSTSVLTSRELGFFLNLFYYDNESEEPIAVESITAFSIKNSVIVFAEPQPLITTPRITLYCNIKKLNKNKTIWISGYSEFAGGVELFARIISSSDANVITIGGEYGIENYSVLEDDDTLYNKAFAWTMVDVVTINDETVAFSYFRETKIGATITKLARILILGVEGNSVSTTQSITINEGFTSKLNIASSQGKVYIYRESREDTGLVNDVLIKRFFSVIEPPGAVSTEIEITDFYQQRSYHVFGETSKQAGLFVFENYIIIPYVGSQIENDTTNINVSLVKINGDSFELKDTIDTPYGDAFSGFINILESIYIVDLKKGVFCVISLNSFVSPVSRLQINPFFFVITIDTANDRLICSDAIEIKEYQNYFEKDTHGYLTTHKIKD